jgi:Domain of unknown function (DUF4129)
MAAPVLAPRHPRASYGERWTAAARLAAAVALLVLAAAGARAREHIRLSIIRTVATGASTVVDIVVLLLVAAAAVILAGLVVMLGRRRRRRDDEFSREPEPAGTRWQRAVAVLAVVALIALVVSAVIAAIHGFRGGRSGSAYRAPTVPALPHLPAENPAPSAGLVILVPLAGLVVLAALALVVVWQHQRRTARAAAPPGAGAADTGPHPAVSPLAAAVASGTSALAAIAGPREAIIGCYAAMEESLAAAGSPRLAADTPEELLDRVVSGGFIRTSAAARLTALFREARFSPHRLGDAQRGAAESALADIARDLADTP